MESQPRGTDWRSILLLIFSLSGMVLAITVAIAALVMVTINVNFLTEFQGTNTSPLAVALTAGALVAISALLAPSAWLSLQRLRGKDARELKFSALPPWAWIATLTTWVLAMIIATVFHDARGASWYVPLLHILSIGLPVYIVIRIGVNRISLGSRQRAWGVFGSGMILSPILAVIVEIAIILFGLILVGVYFGLNPGKFDEFQRLAVQIDNAPSLESLVYLLEPILRNPLTLLTALMFLSVFVPIIEEIAKSIGVWLVSDRLTSPAQGFALGILSGAGFALAESLFASITPDDTWALTLSMRALSGSMHMLASGLVGWGIAIARLEKRYIRLIGMTMLAILIHGFWNAGAVLTIAGGVRVILVMPEFDILGTLFMVGGFGLISLLVLGMFTALFAINRGLLIATEPIPIPDEPVGAVG